jgi:hypothetical protein
MILDSGPDEDAACGAAAVLGEGPPQAERGVVGYRPPCRVGGPH